MAELIVGIDLGTTNSEIAAFVGGEVKVLGPGSTRILPSCAGFTPAGELLVGEAARNQSLVYPERTVRSIKRQMGSNEKVRVGDQLLLPQEVSALILRELCNWAQQSLGERPKKAVVTVPAYFSDVQRTATREAGALAGLEVVRILNEPTAASLAYGEGGGKQRLALVYDLGGGTFDVSVVRMEGDVTEVLASHGNNRLGGDDFDDLLAGRLMDEFQKQHGVDLRQGNAAARARLWWAAEEAKKRLSFEPYARVREESLVVIEGRPLHLDFEIGRHEYEDLIRPLVETTFESVAKALQDAQIRAPGLDQVLLVGGATRTPLISRMLKERTGHDARQDVHPDLCVALGAGVMASRLGGHEIARVLVDVSPFSFGVSFLGERGGVPYPHCYKAIIPRNTPLPLTRTERFWTSEPGQPAVQIRVYQGEDEDAIRNIPVGDFRVTGLQDSDDLVEVLCRMRLDLNGILEVTAIEKETGKTKQITISNALAEKSAEEIAASRSRLEALFRSPEPELEVTAEAVNEVAREVVAEVVPIGLSPELRREATQLVERARSLFETMHPDDREEAIDRIEEIERALTEKDQEGCQRAIGALRELIFFVGGRE